MSDLIAQVSHPALAALCRAEQALIAAKDLGSIKQIIDIAEAARVYIQSAKIGAAAAQHAEEIKLKAQRKAGECLKQLDKSKGGRPEKNSSQAGNSTSPYRQAIEETGITKNSASRWQKVAAIPEPTFTAYLEEKRKEDAEMSTAGLLREVNRAAKEAEREQRRKANLELAKQTPTVISVAKGEKYPTLVLDPPWDWGDEGDVDQLGRARPTYATMPLSEISALPVADLAESNAHLYLWITNRSLPKGFGLLEQWGFRYITMLTWVKPSFGMGNYFRGSTEQVIFGVRGSLPLLRNDVPTHFNADRAGDHSTKPPEFYAMVETCSPGPWLEMFSRRQRPGWVSWGAEAAVPVSG